MDDTQLLRYSRHILLSELGVDAQQRFADSTALVVGVGGLGNPVAHFLAAAGIGTLTMVDADQVDLTNLQRQILFDTGAIGKNKVDAAASRLAAINPDVRLVPINARVGSAELQPLVDVADIVFDCSDNFSTRHAVNRACVLAHKPLISGAAVQFDGQVAVFDMRDANNACYHCLFSEGGDLDEIRCATMGVFAPLVGIIGATQAAEGLKILANIGRSLSGRLLILDALDMQWRDIKVPKDPACPVCGKESR